MSRVPIPKSDAALDLLIQRATEGLDTARERELLIRLGADGLPPEDAERSVDSFELAAAALHLAFAAEDAALEKLPPTVEQQIQARLEAVARRDAAASLHAPSVQNHHDSHVLTPGEMRLVGTSPRTAAVLPSAQPSTTISTKNQTQNARPVPSTAAAGRWAPWRDVRVVVGSAGWIAAAASIAIAVGVVAADRADSLATPAQQLAALKLRASRAPDAPGSAQLVQTTWSTDVNPAVTGEVVWDAERQRGFMVFKGLEPNDPAAEQYQLWIFDDARPTGDLPEFAGSLPILTQRPVDGGVFDVSPNAAGEVVVPIDPKLFVGRAALFVVTREPPGGVVQSDRSRVVTLAAASG